MCVVPSGVTDSIQLQFDMLPEGTDCRIRLRVPYRDAVPEWLVSVSDSIAQEGYLVRDTGRESTPGHLEVLLGSNVGEAIRLTGIVLHAAGYDAGVVDVWFKNFIRR